MGSVIADMRLFSLIASVIASVIARVRSKSGRGGRLNGKDSKVGGGRGIGEN